MAEQATDSVPALIRSVMEDARELVRGEIALARAEIRHELLVVQRAGIAFGAAALLAVIGVVLLCIAMGGAIAGMLNVPAWVGYGIVAVLLLVAAFVMVSRGRAGIANIGGLPKTRESLQENLQWIRSKSASK